MRLLGGVYLLLLETILGLRLPIHAPAVKRISVLMSTDDQVSINDDPPPSALAAQICDLAEALPDHLVCSGSSECPSCQNLTGQARGHDCQAASHGGPLQAEGPRLRIFFRRVPKLQLVAVPRRSWTRVCAALWRLSA